MTQIKDKIIAGTKKLKQSSPDVLRKKMREKVDNLIEKLSELVVEFEQTRQELREIPGTIFYEHAHPEMFPEKPRSY